MPENTDDFDIPKPLDADKPPSIETAVGPGFDRIDELLGAVGLGQLVVPGGTGDDGKIVIVNDGAAAYRAMKGDATIAEDGTLQLGAGVVGTNELAAKAATTAKIDDEAITPDKILEDIREFLGLSSTGQTRRGKSIVATEQSRANAAYGLLTTPDRVQNVVLPTDGLIFVHFQALWKASEADKGAAALFIGENQLRNPRANGEPVVNEAGLVNGKVSTKFSPLVSNPTGLFTAGSGVSDSTLVTTGLAGFYDGVTFNNPAGAICVIEAAAGTYDISVRFKATSGSVTVKERKLRVWTAAFG